MRFSWATMALVAVVATLTLAPVTSALAQRTPDDLKVTLNLKDADLITATQMLTAKTGLQFVVKPSDKPFEKITLKLDDQSAEDAIRYICDAAGAFFKRDENGVFIISRVKFEPDPTATEPSVGASKSFKKTVRKVKLLHADARDVYDQIRSGTPFSTTRGFQELEKFRRMSNSMEPRIFGNTTISGNPQNFTPVGSQAFNANPAVSSGESGNGITLPGEAAGQLGGGGLGGGQGGGRGGGLGGGAGGGGQGGGQGQQVNLTGGQGLVPQSIDYVSYDPTDNSLIVRGTEEDIAELQRMISLFDVAPKQVLIKVEFITTSSSLSRDLGFDFLYQRGTVLFGSTPGSFAHSGDPIFLNYATGNVTTRMRALLSEGYGKVVQAPIIRTLNNQPASIVNQVITSLFINQLVSVGNGQVISAPQLVQIPIQTGLSVAPRINDDNTITMYLNPTVQDFGQLRTGPNGEQVPDQLGQTIQVVARVRNGQTIALGGLTRKSDLGAQQRFPILGDLPIIGQFFRQSSRDRNNSELLIFVTPTILDEDETGNP